MQLMFFQWNGFMQKDLEDVFRSMHISYNRISYEFSDIHSDDYFTARFSAHLSCCRYDAVISFNYFPLVAQVCYEHNIKYISWCYDSPVRVTPFDSFAYPTNYIFMFDRREADDYRRMGYDNIYHLPLAVNSRRLKNLHISNADRMKYMCDISFLGTFHNSNFTEFLNPLPDYYRGYMNSLLKMQIGLRGFFLPDELFTESLLETLNVHYKAYTNNPDYQVTKENLSFLFGKHVTETDRLISLSLLSKRFPLRLYSDTCPELLTSVEFMGTVDYGQEMNKLFRLSKINFNSSFYCIRSGIPLRALDILASGGFLLTNRQEELFDYFEDGKDLAVYDSIHEALEKSSFYLNHRDLRERIAESGREKALNLFSYEILLRKIFETADLI